jgi:hypothetical protein
MSFRRGDASLGCALARLLFDAAATRNRTPRLPVLSPDEMVTMPSSPALDSQFTASRFVPAAEPLVDPTRHKPCCKRAARPCSPRVDRRHPSWALLHRILEAMPVNERAVAPSFTCPLIATIVCVLPILTQNWPPCDPLKSLTSNLLGWPGWRLGRVPGAVRSITGS